MLGPLQNNGGPTFTHALLPGSPAIDTANPFGDVAVDQRGVSRSLSNPDIGAFEALLPPNKRGVSWGDPHIETFDGKNYEFQTLGEFVLVESNSGDLQIQVRQERFNNTSNRVSVNTAVATLVDGTNVGFYLGQNQSLEIDGIDTSLSNGSFLTVGNSHITRVGNTFTIIYAGDDGIVTNEDDRLEVTLYNNHITTEVFLSREREGSVQGILGNGDMDPTNDFALRNGTVLSDQLSLDEIYGEYADSWRISQQESLFNYDPGEDTSTFTELDFPNQTIPLPITVNNLDNLGFTEDQLMNAENVARDAGIPEGPMFDAAVLDFLITNDDSFIDAGADVIDQTPAPLISLTVDTLVDENDGVLIPGDVSLREAILFALPGATINFDPSLAGGTIDLTLGELIIDKDLTINGLGADKLTISGNNTSRVFKVDDGNPNNLINLEISGLTIAEGSTDEGGGIFSTETLSITNSTIRNNQAGDTGGGLYNDGGILNIYNSIIRDNIGHTDTGGIENRGTMMIDNSTISNNQGGSFAGGIRNLSGTATITNSTISGNKANSGGGISNGGYGALLIANSTISGNSALDSGGGIYASSGSLRVFNSTITLNTADSDGDNLDNDDGGGINALSSSTVEVKNTIIAGNFDKSNSGNINPDVAGDFINSSFNFIGDATGSNSFTNNVDGNQVGTSAHPIDPMLGDLQDNGGPTFTHAPLPGSPVLDAANPLAGVTVDQRGISRPQGEGFDIGAVEGSLNPSSVGTRDSDRIVGDSGNNVINGGRGADVIFGGAGNDILRGAGGDDILKGEDGNDRLLGHGGNNSLFGGNDNDTLWGGQRDDLLDGGAGSDRLFGQNGNDTLLGGHDLDLLEGGRGNDLMTGGEGNDIFQLRQSDFMGGTFVDQILDFNAAEDDRLRLVDISMDEVMFNKIGTSDLELTFTFGGKVTFVGVTDAIFVASNVDFDATRLGNNSPLPVS
ncbi:MAG: hypothetical protein F6J86_33990 [Symploca sp. SIO1B1]|nr:hypothetical protein [Symploca sp. SIO1B1]